MNALTITFLIITLVSFVGMLYFNAKAVKLAQAAEISESKARLNLTALQDLRTKYEKLKVALGMQQKLTRWAETEFKKLADVHALVGASRRLKRSDPKFDNLKHKIYDDLINKAYGIKPEEPGVS
jgi:hypothetical protein